MIETTGSLNTTITSAWPRIPASRKMSLAILGTVTAGGRRRENFAASDLAVVGCSSDERHPASENMTMMVHGASALLCSQFGLLTAPS